MAATHTTTSAPSASRVASGLVEGLGRLTARVIQRPARDRKLTACRRGWCLPCAAVDIAVVVNLRARRGSKRVVDACRRSLPDARVMVSESLDDALGFA